MKEMVIANFSKPVICQVLAKDDHERLSICIYVGNRHLEKESGHFLKRDKEFFFFH